MLKRVILVFLSCLCLWASYPLSSMAEIDSDRYDGNIFVVYAGNGSLVPPRLTLKQSFERELPAILVYYLDDNSDSKEFAFIVSRFQEFYGRAASIIPVNVDTIPMKKNYTPDEVGYYYEGTIPQTVILDQNKKEIYNGKGIIEFEEVDDVLRDLFNLLPRSESVQLKRKTFNEFNSELVPEDK
ncbi:hypothetical protein AA637_05285 [Cyanobacterium sp. HL-69]|uniref:thylakoid membrane photosystem I accumulation factor n=1 Tax=Cyanobacterium sp. HL-69 TaxID=2054282 RepID=UPI000CA2937D|nr:hypothetical protein AA637_05285 [Cyanobacterium sp. HL-69]